MGGGRIRLFSMLVKLSMIWIWVSVMTMSNMAAELGGQAGLIAPDEVTIDYIRSVGGTVPTDWKSASD